MSSTIRTPINNCRNYLVSPLFGYDISTHTYIRTNTHTYITLRGEH